MNQDRAFKLARLIGNKAAVYQRRSDEFCVVILLGESLITLDDEGVKSYVSNEGLIRDMPEDMFTLGTRLFCEHCPKPVKCSVCGNP